MQPSALDVYRGVSSLREVKIPCGKCAECLSKRQNDLSSRVYAEAKSKGSAVFVTLTYSPENEPYAQSLWVSDTDTGECTRLYDAEPVVNLETLDVLRHEFVGVKGFREFVRTILTFEGKDYFVRYTPTLYYRDVQLALKRFRKNNPDLPDFTYVFVGEYGQNPNGTYRPHYHCIFFGLTYKDSLKFCNEWKLGFYTCKRVSFINSDGSDGLARVSRYVGKYCSKGKFEFCGKRDGLTIKSRMCTSKGLGFDYIKPLKDYFLAKDVCQYNENDLTDLPKAKLDEICERIVLRSFITIDNFKYALPNSFRRYIFGFRIIKSRHDYPAMFQESVYGFFKKAVYSPIYYYVQDFVRSRILSDDAKKLEEFGANPLSENLASAVAAFNSYQENLLETREQAKEASILHFYQLNSQI